MSKKIAVIVVLLLASCLPAIAQSVTVTPKTVVYKRPKPIMDFKKEFSVIYPKISGVSRALAAKIERAISYETVLKLNLTEEINEYQWLEEATYEVGHNADGILSVALSLSGTGAYPSVYGKTVAVDLRTGDRVTPADVFVNLAGLAAKCRAAQKEEIAVSLASIRQEEPDFAESAAEMLGKAKFAASDLDWFEISKDGVAFRYEYGFPHVAKALEPDGRYFFNWKELKPFIKRTGLLAKFIR